MSSTLYLTAAEYDRMVACGAFDGLKRKVELIRGEILTMNPAGPTHDDYIGYLTDWSVRSQDPTKVRIQVQTGMNLDELDSRPEPDLFWVKRGRYLSRHPTGTDTLLVIEVADSSLKNDRTAKSDLYAEAGVFEYWVVDVDGKCIYVMREVAADKHYGWQRTVHAGDTLTPLAEPNAVLDLADLLGVQLQESRHLTDQKPSSPRGRASQVGAPFVPPGVPPFAHQYVNLGVPTRPATDFILLRSLDFLGLDGRVIVYPFGQPYKKDFVVEIQFAKWGNSVAMRVPSKLVDALGISPGSKADISVKKNQLIITPRHHDYRLDELLARISPENLHREIVTGKAVGAEDVD